MPRVDPQTAEIELLINTVVWSLVPGSILYGFYTLVVILCIAALNRKRRSGSEAGYRFQILSICLMFTLTTGYMIIRIFSLNDGLLPLLTDDEQLGVVTSEEMLSFCVFIMADGILINRCYLVWQRNKNILFLYALLSSSFIVMILSLSNSLPGHAGSVLIPLFFALTMSTNFIVTGLTAYKVYIYRRLSAGLTRMTGHDNELGQRYTWIMNLLLESGAFYILVHVLNLTFNILSSRPDLFNKPNEFLIAAGAFNTLLNVIAALLPTLMLLRVAWGYDSLRGSQTSATLYSSSGIGNAGEKPDLEYASSHFRKDSDGSTKWNRQANVLDSKWPENE